MDVWGDHNRDGIMSQLAALDFDTQTLRVRPALVRALKTYGVSHLLSPFPQHDVALTLVSTGTNAYVYRIDGAARTRFVRAARRVGSDQETVTRLLDPGFVPDGEILLADTPGTVPPAMDDVTDTLSNEAAEGSTRFITGRASVTRDESHELIIEA